jgi:predicted nucleotidyltransferase
MNSKENAIVQRFKLLVRQRLPVDHVVLFGSRARGDADRDADIDVLVVIDGVVTWDDRLFISHCAWEAGFPDSAVLIPTVFTKYEWEQGPERESALASAIRDEGVAV